MLNRVLSGVFATVAAVTIWAAGGAFAEAWVFHYAPDQGHDAKASSARVEVGENAFLVGLYGDELHLAGLVTLGTFDNGGAVQRSLEAGEALTLDVFREGERYKRVLQPTEYQWQADESRQLVQVLFLMAEDDLLAMADGKAVFLWAGDLQFRFPLENAEPAMNELIELGLRLRG